MCPSQPALISPWAAIRDFTDMLVTSCHAPTKDPHHILLPYHRPQFWRLHLSNFKGPKVGRLLPHTST